MWMDWLTRVGMSFVPLFVAVDAIGVLPMFLSLTGDLDADRRGRVIRQSLFTAAGLALGFVLLGRAVFRFLGITIGDFMIAGGAILFCLSILDLIQPGTKERRMPSQDLGAVPLGTPLIAGPAVLTTSLVCESQYGVGPTIVSLILNIALAGLLMRSATGLIRVMGDAGSKALSKIMSLLLASIAVMLIRKGVMYVLAG